MTTGSIANSNVNNSVYPNYVYNTNQVNASSLGKVSPIPKDALQSKVNYSNDLNQNPLRPGQSRDYNATVESQMTEGARNASRIFEESAQTPEAKAANSPSDPVQNPSMNITEVTSSLNQKSAPNADLMKVATPAEKAQEELNTSQVQKDSTQPSVSEAIQQQNQPQNPAEQENMSIAQQAQTINKDSAPNASLGQNAQSGDQTQAIPNVSLS